jgi:hypothetical protein
VQAVEHLIDQKQPEKSEILLAISGTSVIILSWSCAIKYSLSKLLKSSALRKDAITSGACAIMAGTMLVSTTIFETHEGAWWLDSAVAIVVSVVLSALGIKTLITHPWWRKDFWVDGSLPEEELWAGRIMGMPFQKSPKSTHPHELQMQGAQVQGVPPEAVPVAVSGATASRVEQYVAETGCLENETRHNEPGQR